MLLSGNSAGSVWKRAAERLNEKWPSVYTNWFTNVVPVEITGDSTLVLGVSDDFFGDVLTNTYGYMLDEVLDFGDVRYNYRFAAGYLPAETRSEPVPVAPLVATPQVAPPQPIREADAPVNCMNTHTFENFVVGEENRYGYTAAKMVAENPGIYNPLFIYGASGVGKTHLLHAVAHEVRRNNPNAVVRLASCEELLNDFVEMLRSRNQSEFRTVRDVDILLLDDVHILGKAKQLQEEFFNTFNALYRRGKQIILTSDQQPCEINGLEDRLVTRFESGMTTELLAPEFEARLAILKMMREESVIKVKLSDDILEFIAANISSGVRRLRGAFMRVSTYVSMRDDKTITIEDVEGLLQAILENENANRTPSMEDIQRRVAECFGLKVSDILGDKRPKNIAEPRMVAMYLCRKLTKHSLPEIGKAFGRNHATIINAVRKVPELCEKSEDMRRMVQLAERQLKRARS